MSSCPDDKRLISFRIAHDASVIPRSSKPLDPASKPFELRPPLIIANSENSTTKRVEHLERELNCARLECASLRRALEESRREAFEARSEAEAARKEAAHHLRCVEDAETGLEQEAELVWDEAEAWVEHEEALELREEYFCWPSTTNDDAESVVSETSADEEVRRERDAVEKVLGLDEVSAITVPPIHLHEKLSSPQRRPPSPAETKRRHDERQLGAERNRATLRLEHRQRLREAAEHAEHVRARSHEWRSDRQASMASRHARASDNHAAYIASVRRRAVRETAKVEEVSFINALTSQEVQSDLRRRLQEVESRIDEARNRRQERLEGLQAKQKKRERAKQQQLSAQSIKRAEMAAERWEKLQLRLAAVEKRRADRLERARVARSGERLSATSQKVTQRRRDDNGGPLTPIMKEDNEQRFFAEDDDEAATRCDSVAVKGTLLSPSAKRESSFSSNREKENKDGHLTPSSAPRDDESCTTTAEKTARRRRSSSSKKAKRRRSSGGGSSKTKKAVDACDNLTVEAAVRVETAFGGSCGGSSSGRKSLESNARVAAKLLLSAATLAAKGAATAPTDVRSEDMARALSWALRRWLERSTSSREDDEDDSYDEARVAIAACELTTAVLHEERPLTVLSEIAPFDALRETLGSAASSPRHFGVAAAALRLVTALVQKASGGNEDDSSSLFATFCFGMPHSPSDNEEDEDGAGRHCAGAVVAALVAACLSSTPPTNPRHQLGKWRLSLHGLRALNALARLERTRLDQAVFSNASTRPQLLHLFDHLFSQIEVVEGDSDKRIIKEACLDDLVELVGHFALHNQECLQWGPASRLTLLLRLVRLPFRYFSRTQHKDVLFPTLVASCFCNDRNSAVVAQELSLRVLADYVRASIDLRTTQSEKAEESTAGLKGRVPETLWPEAAAYFDRLCDADTLD